MMNEAVDSIMRIAKKWNPDQLEAYWSRNRITIVRMALRDIVEAKTMLVEGASVRFVLGKSIGFASTTELSAASLERMVEASYRAAKSKSSDPDFKSLPEATKPKAQLACDRMLLELDLARAVELGYDALRATRTEGPGLDFSGSINIVVEECAVLNSLGVDVSDSSASVFSSYTVEESGERSAIGQDCSRSLRAFDPAKAALAAVKDIRQSKQVVAPPEPGSYDVILGPHAVAELVEYVLTYALDLSAVDAGMSYLRGRLGESVGVESLSITDDGRRPDGIASKSVDDEGVPTGVTPLIVNGVLLNYLSDSYYAAKMSSPLLSFRSTGNGFRIGPVPGRDYSSLPHVQPTNIVVDPGDKSLEEIIRETDRGLLIGRIWYSYPINPTIGEFSTTNRGNTQYIEHGEAKHSILPNSFRINDKLPRLLKQIEGISKEQTQSIVWGGVSSCFSPHIRFSDVRITSQA